MIFHPLSLHSFCFFGSKGVISCNFSPNVKFITSGAEYASLYFIFLNFCIISFLCSYSSSISEQNLLIAA